MVWTDWDISCPNAVPSRIAALSAWLQRLRAPCLQLCRSCLADQEVAHEGRKLSGTDVFPQEVIGPHGVPETACFEVVVDLGKWLKRIFCYDQTKLATTIRWPLASVHPSSFHFGDNPRWDFSLGFPSHQRTWLVIRKEKILVERRHRIPDVDSTVTPPCYSLLLLPILTIDSADLQLTQ